MKIVPEFIYSAFERIYSVSNYNPVRQADTCINHPIAKFSKASISPR